MSLTADIDRRLIDTPPLKRSLKLIKTITQWPKEVQRYCHLKQYVLKQCQKLRPIKTDILLFFASTHTKTPLSASQFQLACTLTQELLELRKNTLSELIQHLEINLLLEQNIPPHQKTQKLLATLNTARHPTLSTLQHQLKEKAHSLNLPKHTHISRDPALEDKEITLTASLKTPHDLPLMLKHLSQQNTQEALHHLLNQL